MAAPSAQQDKQKQVKKTLIAVFAVVLVVIVSLWSLRKILLEVAIQSIASDYGIDLKFTIKEVGLHSLSVDNVHIGENTKIKSLQIKINSYDLVPTSVDQLEIDVSTLDFSDLNPLLVNKSRSPHTSSPLSIQLKNLKRHCDLIRKKDWSLSVDTIYWRDVPFPLHLNLGTTEQGGKASFYGSIEDFKHQEIEVSESEYKGQIHWKCDSNELQLNVGPMNVSAAGKTKNQDWAIASTNVQMAFNSTRSNGLEFNASGDNLILQANESIRFPTFNIQLNPTLENPMVSQGSYSVGPLQLTNKKGQVLARDVILSGEIQSSPQTVIVKGDLQAGPIAIKYSGKYDLPSNNYELIIPQQTLNFVPETDLSSLSDLIRKMTVKGKMSLSGVYNLTGGQVSTQWLTDIKDLTVDSDLISFSNADVIKNKLVSLNPFRSGTHQRIKVAEVEPGSGLKNLDVTYQLNGLDSIELKKFSMDFEGTHFKTKPTTVKPISKHFSDTEVRVTDYPLQNLLALLYREDVRATGVLNGKMDLKMINKRPVIENGEFKSLSKGWIKLRPPGKAAPGPNDFVQNPSQIVNNYLYDFAYEEVSADFSSDLNFDLKMTLRILGRNPGYLDGKPLKLSVNLDLNLLGLLKSLILGRQLSTKLQERLLEKLNQQARNK